LLPESWTSSTLAFLDPYEMRESTDAGITPLELACELASRTIVTLLFYTFSDETGREERQKLIMQSLEKSRLMKRAHRFEGALACPAEGSPTQWGFGMLAINLRDDARLAVDQKLRALAAAYGKCELNVPGGGKFGPWRYAQSAL
jgi:hypothetical protein